ncbi:hypothetical protein J2X54_001542 [Duganella sp. 3397]|uniref:DUF4123 domain-containing protein n=1 Tax=Duganella sp. 3397 TaxID=2817732 RepID=UPI0028661E9E|nr:DUF4123 domain-containing protein [Duganella sp. 3397]MDR7049094.1 hypothetical protein [Duganella sp. 3397]
MIEPAENTFDYKILATHKFCLVDPNAVGELPDSVSGKPLVPDELANSAHLMPVLLNLRTIPEESGNALLNALYEAHSQQERPVVRVLVETDADTEQFTRQWNSLQLVSLDTGVKSWLRIHDPRVLHQLWRVLTPGQRHALLGKARSISYWIAGQWVKISTSDEANPNPDQVVSSPYQGTSGWDWRRIEQIGIINRALELLDAENPLVLQRQAEMAEDLIARAKALHGLSIPEDLVEFVYRGLSSHPLFDQHPALVKNIRRPGDPSDDSTLADRLALIDETIWNGLHGQTVTSSILQRS